MNKARRNARRKLRNQRRFFVCPTMRMFCPRSQVASSCDWRFRRHPGRSFRIVRGDILPLTAWAFGRGYLSKREAIKALNAKIANSLEILA
jgi:hypothetical protein